MFVLVYNITTPSIDPLSLTNLNHHDGVDGASLRAVPPRTSESTTIYFFPPNSTGSMSIASNTGFGQEINILRHRCYVSSEFGLSWTKGVFFWASSQGATTKVHFHESTRIYIIVCDYRVFFSFSLYSLLTILKPRHLVGSCSRSCHLPSALNTPLGFPTNLPSHEKFATSIGIAGQALTFITVVSTPVLGIRGSRKRADLKPEGFFVNCLGEHCSPRRGAEVSDRGCYLPVRLNLEERTWSMHRGRTLDTFQNRWSRTPRKGLYEQGWQRINR